LLLLSSTQNGHVDRATEQKNKILNSAMVSPYFIHNTRLIANTSQTLAIYSMISFVRITSTTQFFLVCCNNTPHYSQTMSKPPSVQPARLILSFPRNLRLHNLTLMFSLLKAKSHFSC